MVMKDRHLTIKGTFPQANNKCNIHKYSKCVTFPTKKQGINQFSHSITKYRDKMKKQTTSLLKKTQSFLSEISSPSTTTLY